MERTGYLRLIWSSKRWTAAVSRWPPRSSSCGLLRQRRRQVRKQGPGSDRLDQPGLGGNPQRGTAAQPLEHLPRARQHRTGPRIAHEDPTVKGRAQEFDSSVDDRTRSQGRVARVQRAKTSDPTKSADFANAYAERLQPPTSNSSRSTSARRRCADPAADQRDQRRTRETSPAAASGRPPGRAAGAPGPLATETANPGDTMRVVEQAVPASTTRSRREPKRDAAVAFIVALLLGACVDLPARHLLRPLRLRRGGGHGTSACRCWARSRRVDGAPALEAFRSLRTAMMLALERGPGEMGARALGRRSGHRC